ncbi:glycosyl transferase, partial [Mycobacterium sp. ITM-2017-0098]
GPAVFDPPAEPPPWLADIDKPIVLVTTSSVRQADQNLVKAAVAALRDEPVHVVATVPAGAGRSWCSDDGATFARFVPHSLILDRAVCVVTHGG